jgi:hypothetical protein
MVEVPVRTGVLPAAVSLAPTDVDALDVDVDLHHGQAKRALDRVANSIGKVVGDFRHASAVLDDDVEGDGDAVVPDLDLDAAMQVIPMEPFGEAVA